VLAIASLFVTTINAHPKPCLPVSVSITSDKDDLVRVGETVTFNIRLKSRIRWLLPECVVYAWFPNLKTEVTPQKISASHYRVVTSPTRVGRNTLFVLVVWRLDFGEDGVCEVPVGAGCYTVWALPKGAVLEILSREFAFVRTASPPKLRVHIKKSATIPKRLVRLQVGRRIFGARFLKKVRYGFEPADSEAKDRWVFEIPRRFVGYDLGDKLDLKLRYGFAVKPVSTATPTMLELELLRADTFTPARSIVLAPPEEWENPTSPYGLVVRVRGKAGCALPQKVKVESWSMLEGEVGWRYKIGEAEVGLMQSEVDLGTAVSGTVMFSEQAEEVIPGWVTVLPGEFGGLATFRIGPEILLAPNAKKALWIQAVYGLHKAKDAKGSKNQGRIYTNHTPDGRIKPNTQYVVIHVRVLGNVSPDKHYVRFKVYDPDDPSDLKEIDGNDDKKGKWGNDNYDVWPEWKGEDKRRFFQQVAGYELTRPETRGRGRALELEKAGKDAFREKVLCRIKPDPEVKGAWQAEVKLHVTDAAGDNYKVIAELVELKDDKEEVVKEKVDEQVQELRDETGIMTVWRKVRVEMDAMVDAQGRVYPEKWLGRNWRKVLIEQLNESFNPRRFLRAAEEKERPPANICYTEFTDAGASDPQTYYGSPITYKRRIHIDKRETFIGRDLKTIKKKHLCPLVATHKGSYLIDTRKMPDYVHLLILSEAQEDLKVFGVPKWTFQTVVVFAGRIEKKLREFAQAGIPREYAKKYYRIDRAIPANWSAQRLRRAIALMLRKVTVHEFGHLFTRAVGSGGHRYYGEAIIPTRFSMRVLEILGGRRIQIVVGRENKRFHEAPYETRSGGRRRYHEAVRARIGGTDQVAGDVMTQFWRRKVSRETGKFLGLSSDVPDPLLTYDRGSLRQVYFAPRRTRWIREKIWPLVTR